MVKKKGLQFQLTEWQQYQTFFLELINMVNKLCLKFLSNDSSHFRLEVEPSLILIWQSICNFELEDPHRRTPAAFWSYKRIFVSEIYRKVLFFHYNKIEKQINDEIYELDLEALAQDSHQAKEDPFENAILQILNNNLNSLMPQRQGLLVGDEVDSFEARFVTKTI